MHPVLGESSLPFRNSRRVSGNSFFSSTPYVRIRISLCPVYRIAPAFAPFSSTHSNALSKRIFRRKGSRDEYIYIYTSRLPFPLHVHVQGLCARWLYQRRRIIQFYPETTHLYAFVWLNLSPPPRRLLSPSRPDFHPVRLFILPPVLLSFPSVLSLFTDTGLHPSLPSSSCSHPPNAVSCFNFPSPRKTERRARHLPCPIPPRFHFSLSLTRVQSDLQSATPLVNVDQSQRDVRKCTSEFFFNVV